MRRLIIALVLLAGCAGGPAAPLVRPEPETRPDDPDLQAEVRRRQRDETARAELARVPTLRDDDARRIALARIHRLSPDLLPGLDARELARLAPTVLRVYRLREALEEGPDSPLADADANAGWDGLDGRDRRARRLADAIREALPADRWPADGTFLDLRDTDLVILQRPERFAALEKALDRHVSSRSGSVEIRVDLVPDGESFARGLGLGGPGGSRKAWLPQAPAQAVAPHRLASVRLDVPWGRRVGVHVAPGHITPGEGPADSGRPAPSPADANGPGLTVVAMRIPPTRVGDPTDHFDVEIVWRASAANGSAERSRHRTSVAIRRDLPALVTWPGGPGAILWVIRDSGGSHRARPAWRQLLP